MLDRERADFFRTLAALREQLSDRCVAIQLPIGSEHELQRRRRPAPQLRLPGPRRAPAKATRSRSPTRWPALAAEYREKLLDAVVETDEALMERYLGGEELDPAAVAAALKTAVTNDELYPVACGVATKNLGTHALLDLLVEGVPSPARKPAADRDRRRHGRVRLQDGRRPVRGPHLVLPRLRRLGRAPTRRSSTCATRPRSGSAALMMLQGKEHEKADALRRPATSAPSRSSRTSRPATCSPTRERELEPPRLEFTEPVMSFAVTPKTKGDEDKVAQALRRLHEEDPTLQLRRDPQTGEQLLSGMSQVHVEVAVARLKSRFGVEVELHQPRVPYVETIKSEARAQGRYKKQTGGRGQFGDCVIVIEPLEGHVGYEFVDQIVGGVIPHGFRPAVDKGVQETMAHGDARRRARSRACACASSTAPTTPSTRPRWRSRSPARWPSSRPTRRRSRRCSSRSWSSR